MKETLMEIIKNIGNENEFNLFFRIFRDIDPTKFAVIKVSGEVLENNLENFAKNIAYLNKLEIYPVIIHGAGTKLDTVLPASKKINGYRYTKKEDMLVISKVLHEISEKLEERIIYHGGKAKRILDIFKCKRNTVYGEVGIVKSINIQKIESTIISKASPIVSPIGKCRNNFLNINADTAAREITNVLKPYKVILITGTGGVLDEEGKIIPFLDPEEIESYKMISGGMLLKLNEIRELVRRNRNLSVSITSHDNIIKEMFTVKGSGTFIKMYSIKSVTNIYDINKEKLKVLLEKTFKRALEPKYFESDIIDIIYEEDYEGVAIIKEVEGVPYLDKFATSIHRQGTGLGGHIWKKITQKYTKLTWRALFDNPINNFYYNKCSGCIKIGKWNIYWLNLSENEIIRQVKYIENIPASLL